MNGSVGRLLLQDVEVVFDRFALGPVSLGYDGGQIVALLGPNGSGKSTLMRCVVGLQPEVSGEVNWSGQRLNGRPPGVLADIGYMSDSADDLLPELTFQEYCELCTLAYLRTTSRARRWDPDGMAERARDLARALDFAPPRTTIASFSLGMRRKVQLIGALLHCPRLIILDEPLIGLDVISLLALRDLLARERQRGALILLSSHDLRVARDLADHVILLHGGKVVLADSVRALATHEPLDSTLERTIVRAKLGTQ